MLGDSNRNLRLDLQRQADLIQLKATHEKADIRLMLHAVHSQFHTVVGSSRDIDALVLLASHFPHVQCKRLWKLSGSAKKSQYIPIDSVFINLPKHSAANLWPFYALSVTPRCTSHITPRNLHGKSLNSTINCCKTWELGNSHRKPFNLQRRLSAKYTMYKQTLLTLRGTYSSQQLGNQRPCHQQVMSCAFMSCVCIIKQWFGEMPTVPYLSFLQPWTWDGSVLNQDYNPFSCH